jgi:hypothetical protein
VGLVDTRPVPGIPQSPRVFAGIALRSQAGFEEGYSLLVVKPLGDDDDLYSVEPRFSIVRNVDQLSAMATPLSHRMCRQQNFGPVLNAIKEWKNRPAS